jgi:deoxycytidylate deaminase
MLKTAFRICQRVAEFSDHHQHKIGAAIVKGGKILSTGFNKLKTHTLSPHPFKSCHAEFMAIKYLDKEALEGTTIYVFRKNKKGEIVNSKPCPSCYKLITDSGIKQIYYTHETGIKMEYINRNNLCV